MIHLLSLLPRYRETAVGSYAYAEHVYMYIYFNVYLSMLLWSLPSILLVLL